MNSSNKPDLDGIINIIVSDGNSVKLNRLIKLFKDKFGDDLTCRKLCSILNVPPITFNHAVVLRNYKPAIFEVDMRYTDPVISIKDGVSSTSQSRETTASSIQKPILKGDTELSMFVSDDASATSRLDEATSSKALKTDLKIDTESTMFNSVVDFKKIPSTSSANGYNNIANRDEKDIGIFLPPAVMSEPPSTNDLIRFDSPPKSSTNLASRKNTILSASFNGLNAREMWAIPFSNEPRQYNSLAQKVSADFDALLVRNTGVEDCHAYATFDDIFVNAAVDDDAGNTIQLEGSYNNGRGAACRRLEFNIVPGEDDFTDCIGNCDMLGVKSDEKPCNVGTIQSEKMVTKMEDFTNTNDTFACMKL